MRDERPAVATSAARVAADDRTWKMASEARTFIRSREEPSSADLRPHCTADPKTSKRSESFSLDTALIVELQNMTNEAAIRDMIRRIEQSMTLAASLAEDQPSTSTTTITLPVEPPTSTSTFEESPSKHTRSSTVDTQTPATSEETSRFTSGKKGSATRESTSSTTSSKGESSNATGKTESDWYPFCLQFKVLALVAVAVLLFVVVVLIPRLNRTRGSLARSSQERRDWSSVCKKPACHRALDSLIEPMDLNVSPCDDFYRHVCGRWRARNPKRLSYASENHHNFLMGIHRRLAGHSFDSRWNGSDTPPNHGGCERRNRIVAAFYASCLHFGRRPSIPSLRAVLSRVPKKLSFYVRGLVEVGEVLRALGDWREPDVVNLYTLLVPAAQLFAYVRPWLVPRNDREDRVIPACLRATEHRFVSVFSSMLAAWTETNRARLYFRDMVSTLRRALGNTIPDKNDLARNEVDAYVAFRVVTIAERNQSECACRMEDLSSISLSINDFIGNLILLFKEDRFTSAKQSRAHIAKAVKDGLYQLPSCLGSFVSGAGHTVIVPPLYLSGELLQAEASEPSLDVPTVGVPILISWARSIMSTGEDDWSTTAASYGSCVRKNHPLDHALSDRASDEALLTNALLVPWAISVALTAAATMTGIEHGAFSYAASKSSVTGTVDDGIPKELEEVFDIIEQSKGQMITWLKDLVAIPSVSAEKQHHKDIMRAIKETGTILQEQGVHITEAPLGDQQLQDGSKVPLPPLLLATTGQEAAKKTLCVYGHLDVYPARKEDGWTADPFLPTEQDGRLFARGVASVKGPLVAWIAALYAFRKSAAKAAPVNLKFLIESMEEVGSQGLDSYLAANAKEDFFKGINFVCVADGFWLNQRTPCLSYGLRGLCSFNVEIGSAKPDLESGADGGALHEPMADVVFLLDSLMGTRGHVAIEGFHEDVAPITDTEWKLYEHVDFDPSEVNALQALLDGTRDGCGDSFL
ncbi:hypothetical protein HPB52_011971 [Rhipicephalus sanguineus]|uniref:Uncharacterized protein n=1 Tax=Rhipicephalus sanguineus TaxID=34632 RepID=A0A9D4Q6D8_RHISA|nr:hypothetical protein HPB52_011971 [Rhipicephalus sanguineus]